MESILARALEYTLKYWLKSFTREQFKLQGRTVQLYNLDINGDALHSSMGLPPAINVTTARVGKLEIMLPYVSNVQIEPIIVQIDRLDLVLEENADFDESMSPSSAPSSPSSAKGSGYGFADKIADGMTIEVRTVNLLLETRRGGRHQGGAAWASPMASVTIRNLLLYTTNENWQVVSLKEARDFSVNKKFIYVFRKLEWESLSIDLLPHPDMFVDPQLAQEGPNRRDGDGAKRIFFGGERFVEGISGQAYITLQRTELNSPLGLEVQLHIPEAVCPSLSEPGLRALLRFFTGLYVCLNRGDVDAKAQQRSTEAAGRSLVSIAVDHIFLCIKDAEFQLEFLMQSLFFSRASVSDGENANNLTKIEVGGLFLRDTFSRPPCTLIQPSMRDESTEILRTPDFAENFLPPIYPLEESDAHLSDRTPLMHLYSLQVKPSPTPPRFATQTVIDCQSLMIHLQEESCLRISSFLADGIVVNPGTVLPDFSINSLKLRVNELDLSIPVDSAESDDTLHNKQNSFQSSFGGARLHIENLLFSESPSTKLKILNLEKDPACFSLWEDQPVDASQKKWITKASNVSLSLETTNNPKLHNPVDWLSGLWKCVEIKDACIEVAMATADGCPLIDVPPPGGLVRIGVAFNQYSSNTSLEQLFFVLDLYAYFGRVSDKIARVGRNKSLNNCTNESFDGRLMEKVPSDTAASLDVKYIQLSFLESCSLEMEGLPLVQFVGEDFFVKVSHRTLGGAIAISSAMCWRSVEVDCVDTEGILTHENDTILASSDNGLSTAGNGCSQLRTILWVHEKRKNRCRMDAVAVPFLDINMVQVIPYSALDRECHTLTLSACIAGVRMGGGMSYAEALLHRFGILGPDGGPGEGLSKGLQALSAGPLSKLFNTSHALESDIKENGHTDSEGHAGMLYLGKPDDVDVSVELKDWLFALEGAEEMAERWWFQHQEDIGREDRCWQTTFRSVLLKAKGNPKHSPDGRRSLQRIQKYPVDVVRVGVEGLQILKPQAIVLSGMYRRIEETPETSGGINLEAQMIIAEAQCDDDMDNWLVESLKFSVKQPIEAVVSKDELQHLAILCKSEIDSTGRIVAGFLRVLKLESSVGQAAIDQLSNLGSEGLEKIFSPGRLSRGSSATSSGLMPPANFIGESRHPNVESTFASLEEAVSGSQASCAALIADLGCLESSVQHLGKIKLLNDRLESMHNLVAQLRTQL